MARTTTSTTPAGPNKAQAEFDKYTKRRRAQAAPPSLWGPQMKHWLSFMDLIHT